MDEGFTAYRFRLYPTKKQEKRMLAVLETCRLLWNEALEERNERRGAGRKTTTYEQQAAELTLAKEGSPELRAVHSQVLQNALKRLDGAFKKFFAREAGHPRLKKFSSSGSFTYPQASKGVKVDLAGKRLCLSKIGAVKVAYHRKFPLEGLKACCVRRETDGKWHASLVFEEVVPLQGIDIPNSWKAPVGIDLGLKSLIATSDGQKVEPPKFLRKAERKITRLQRGLSRKQKGSRNRGKARLRLAKQYSHVARQRRDFNQKLSMRLVKKHDLIGFEDLSIRNMVQNHHLAKSIHDAGWAQLVTFAEYKVRRREGKMAVKIPAPFTTQECWSCGALNKVPLSVRRFWCAGCGRWLDRDVNAGRVVLARAIAKVGQDRSNVTRVESEPHSQPVPELMPVEAAKSRPSGSAELSGKQELHAPRQALEAQGFGRGRMSHRGQQTGNRCLV